MPGSSHLAVFCRAKSIVKVSLSDRFKFFSYFGRIIVTSPQKENKKNIEIPKQKTSCFCN